MLANLITFLRVLLTFSVIVVLKHVHPLHIVCIPTISLIFFLDAIDGIVARRRNETSEFGARLDIIGDRVIEMVFWVYFTAASYLPLWIPFVVLTRGILTDNVKKSITTATDNLVQIHTNTLMVTTTKRRIIRLPRQRPPINAHDACVWCSCEFCVGGSFS